MTSSITPNILLFTHERETKNMVRYTEQSAAPIIGTLYVAKLALPRPFPTQLRVTIEIIPVVDQP